MCSVLFISNIHVCMYVHSDACEIFVNGSSINGGDASTIRVLYTIMSPELEAALGSAIGLLLLGALIWAIRERKARRERNRLYALLEQYRAPLVDEGDQQVRSIGAIRHLCLAFSSTPSVCLRPILCTLYRIYIHHCFICYGDDHMNRCLG